MSDRIFHAAATITLIDRSRHSDKTTVDLLDEYVEQFWLPILGPASVAVLRWCGRERPQQFPVGHLGATLGVTAGDGQWSPIWKTLNRLKSFGLLDHNHDGEILAVYSRIMPLNKVRVGKLTPALRAAERQWWSDGGHGDVLVKGVTRIG